MVKTAIKTNKDDDNIIMGTEEEKKALEDLAALAAQPQVKEELHCPYQDPTNAEKPCPFHSRSEVVLQMHERAKHKETKTSQDEESKTDTKKSKRMETKVTRFTESKTPSEYRRKMIEFDLYSRMCGIKEEEVSDDLYMACETPLKQKLLASAKISADIKSTNLLPNQQGGGHYQGCHHVQHEGQKHPERAVEARKQGQGSG